MKPVPKDRIAVKLLALDLSKSCPGWAFWKPGDERAVLGHFTLGGSYASNGDCFAKLQGKDNKGR